MVAGVGPDVRGDTSGGVRSASGDELAVNGTAGQILVVYHAEPGSESYRALRRLDA